MGAGNQTLVPFESQKHPGRAMSPVRCYFLHIGKGSHDLSLLGFYCFEIVLLCRPD